MLAPKSRITNAEATVVQKLHQGTIPKSGRHRFRGSFFVSFLEKQKRKEKTSGAFQKTIAMRLE